MPDFPGSLWGTCSKHAGEVIAGTVGVWLPGQANNPTPADAAAGVAVNTDLSWTAGTDATSHNVYFGVTSPGASQGNQAGTTFDTGTMIGGTIYYWRIDEVGANGTRTGVGWSFETVGGGGGLVSAPAPDPNPFFAVPSQIVEILPRKKATDFCDIGCGC